MPFFNDYMELDLDVYESIFLYLILGGDSTKVADREGENFIFPSLCRNPSRVAPVVTGIIRQSLSAAFEPVLEFYCGTSLRMGGGTHIANHPRCNLWHAIARGGWKLQGDCRAFEYILGCMISMSIAGRGLSGWPYPESLVIPPRCVFWEHAEPNVLTQANNFKFALFQDR
jgi:hypothetical protein